MRTHTRLFIDGAWVEATGGGYTDIYDPTNGEIAGRLTHAGKADLATAVAASQAAFKVWRARSAFERCKVIRAAAELLRERAPQIAALMTREQGKPLKEARIEIELSADLLDWFAEEGRRVYGRVIQARGRGINQVASREPVGPVAAFTPWNFPISQAIRKIGPALAAGCSMVIKPPEETPATTGALADIFQDAGLPAGTLNFVYGVPSEISEYLISNPAIRKVSFTGSVSVGKHIAALAGIHMKRCTMELGGHAPAIVFDDADIDAAVKLLTFSKYRNCGQVCVSPTRFIIQTGVYDEFRRKFIEEAARVRVGNGDQPDTMMGPLISARRLHAVQELITDAVERGAKLELGGGRVGQSGHFLEPTVLSDVTVAMRIMNEEPFGPVALLSAFESTGEVIEEGNRLSYGLASYAFTRSAATASRLSSELEVGMLSINHLGLGLPETPFGGVKDSGYGSEGGTEAIESYLVTKFVSHATV
ncbi:succinate-semialdehyde dehydrogenase/glutarate-semialdehyde dehydrogenase [Paraburkholderia sp. BL6665CI2N2]|uniref:NAD-dependent succinate-semialdehyde dehydrogenase n=1 Tax=Paraburkholderia sp. BL6665CI2N2 TaxID=1938806 RepID=UPI0010665933|nr:NAD-dependent succinate-semialdehyde dehydrogenase [Paraburkholderia sp. BL6665CI2N2]TDY22030.1 succinate-semialdehyde dehydrogenase/glutarate-semialdehyde dehydrogenase [Paraburkholderia sp. BL6665CI2N2]